MPSINWDTVATAAATAAIVTLVVEYAAKPRLEARKERILAAHRSRRELSIAIRGICVTAAFLGIDMPKDAVGAARTKLLAERARKYEQMCEQARRMFDLVDAHAATYPGWMMEAVMSYIGNMQGVMLSARTQHAQARLVQDLSRHAAGLVDARMTHPISFMNARSELELLIRSIQESGDGSAPVPATMSGGMSRTSS